MKNTSKKIIAAALAAATIFGTGLSTGTAGFAKFSPMAITVSAEEGEKIVKDGITYTYSNGRIISASGKFSSSYTVPTKLNGKAVTEIGECAYEDAGLKTLTIPENIESIGTGAFYNCGLETVYFNAVNCDVRKGYVDNFYAYNNPAFFKNSSLTKVVFGDKVKSVPANVFAGVKSLETVEFKTAVTEIGYEAFYDCSSLETVVYPGGKTAWKKVTISEGNDSLKNVTVKSTSSVSAPVVTATNVASSGKVKLTWNAVSGAKEYKVYRATSKNGTYKLMKTTTSTSYINTSAVAGKTYYYKVTAVDANGKTSAFSEIKTRTCDLARPANVKISVTSKGNPKVTWNKVDGATKYQVYRATSKTGTYKLMKTTTNTSYTNTSFTSGKTYYYKVKAVCDNSAAASAYSTVVSVKAK